MAEHARPAGRARPWRSWLHGFVRDLASDEWEQPGVGPVGPEPDDPEAGTQASLDEVLRDAAGGAGGAGAGDPGGPDDGDGPVG